MRRHLALFLFLIVIIFSLAACHSQGTYDDGFEDGYHEGHYDGYLDASIEFEDDYSRGYDDGHSEGYRKGYDDSKIEFALALIENAEDYASEQTGWSVYEAWNSISIYHEGVDPDGFEIPTKEEYRQCVDTLVLFCEYLDGKY